MADETNKTVTEEGASVDPNQDAQKAVTGEEGLTEEEKTQKANEDAQNLKDEEHKEKSKLGRRLSAMEQDAETRGVKLDATIEKMEAFLTSNANTATTTDYEANLDEPLTRREWERLSSEKDSKVIKDRTKYENYYLRQVNKLGQDEDPEFHEEIQEEMMKNFNVKYSSDPIADADRNYLRATRALLKKGTPTKENPLKGKTPKGALGTGGDTHMKEGKEFVMPALDDDAKDYINRKKLSEEKVKKYLSRKTSIGLSKEIVK